jgi:perosamine synthetase
MAPDLNSRPSAYAADFAQYLGGAAGAFPFWKGRAALYAILRALEIGPGDEVILPGFTCVVVPNAVRLAGARPVYADIKPGSYHMDLGEAAAKISPRTKAVVVQHTFGIAACLDEALQLAQSHGLFLIEDCAHALGTAAHGRHVGLTGHAAFFSSQWSKPYTTGLGGIAVTRSHEIAARLAEVWKRSIQPPLLARLRLFLQYQGYKSLFTPRMYWGAQAALQGLSQVGLFVGSSSTGELEGAMPRDHDWQMGAYQQVVGQRELARFPLSLDSRQSLVELYERGLVDNGWNLTARPSGTVMLRFPVRVGNKDALLEQARQARIELGSWFETPLHPTPLAQHSVFGYTLGECPNAEQVSRQVVNLPLHGRVSAAEGERILSFFLDHAQPPGETS